MFSGLVLDLVFLLLFFNLNFFDSQLKLSKAVKLFHNCSETQSYSREEKMMIVKYLGFSSNNYTKLLLINYQYIFGNREKEKWGKTQERRPGRQRKEYSIHL